MQEGVHNDQVYLHFMWFSKKKKIEKYDYLLSHPAPPPSSIRQFLGPPLIHSKLYAKQRFLPLYENQIAGKHHPHDSVGLFESKMLENKNSIPN